MSLSDAITRLPLPFLHHWGYGIIFLVALLEASPLFGLLIPGQTIVILGGFFAERGVLDLGGVILVSALGAIMGDFLGYILGKKYGYSFITHYGKYFFFKKEHFEKTKKIMNHHTGKTLIVGRFNSLTRAFAPFVAGASDVDFMRFFMYNIMGGISWAIFWVVIGYLFGTSYEIAARYFGKFMFMAIVFSVIIIYLYQFINKRKHIFSKYHLYALILNIFSLYLFSKMIEDIMDTELVTTLDAWFQAHVVLIWNPLLNRVMIFITTLASPSYLFFLSLFLFAVLMYKKRGYQALLLFFGITGGLVLEFLIKQIIQRTRPENSLIEVSGYSFPSGHATLAIIFFSVLLYSFKDDIKNTAMKYGFIAGNILLFLLIGFSRVYLQVHWLSDVIAGFALGLFWLTLLILVFKILISLSKKTRDLLLSLFSSKN